MGTVSTSLFPFFTAWLKREKGKVSRWYDFRLIEEWIQGESVENLNSSQEIINKTFYK